jgi:hypothetical protein
MPTIRVLARGLICVGAIAAGVVLAPTAMAQQCADGEVMVGSLQCAPQTGQDLGGPSGEAATPSDLEAPADLPVPH